MWQMSGVSDDRLCRVYTVLIHPLISPVAVYMYLETATNLSSRLHVCTCIREQNTDGQRIHVARPGYLCQCYTYRVNAALRVQSVGAFQSPVSIFYRLRIATCTKFNQHAGRSAWNTIIASEYLCHIRLRKLQKAARNSLFQLSFDICN